MNDARSQSSLKRGRFELWDWVVLKGIFGFGQGFALLSLARKIYRGEVVTWDQIKYELPIQVVVLGAAWGFLMYLWYRRKYARSSAAE